MEEKGSVEYKELPVLAVRKILLSRLGFAPCSCLGSNEGVQYNNPNPDYVGILYQDPDEKPRKLLFGLIETKPKRKFIGVVWFDNEDRSATPENWVFEVYGRKYVELAKKLADEMVSVCNTKINLRLTKEEPPKEGNHSVHYIK